MVDVSGSGKVETLGLEFRPIGIVHSPWVQAVGTPIQPSRVAERCGSVELLPAYVEGLRDLEGFSHIILLCYMDRARRFDLTVVPYLDTQPRGLFATRAPSRPNPIGLSIVRLCRIDGAVLHVEGIDLLDGTPVLDIKPYVPEFDSHPDASAGWIATARNRGVVADDRFNADPAGRSPQRDA